MKPYHGTARGRPSLVAVLAALIAGTAFAGSEPARSFDPDAALTVSQAAIGRTVGDYAFLDRNGKQVRLADFRGRPLLVNFLYTGCTSACPASTKLLAETISKARAVVGADSFRVVSIGFNLPFDSPSAMRDFARRFGLDTASWEFLSPYDTQLEGLLADFGFSYARTSWGFDHTSQVTVVDQQGKIYRQVYGDRFPVWFLIEPLKELVEGKPAPIKSVADLVERVRILCTVYDPRTNTYRFKTSVIGEIVSFAAITIALVWFLWFERRRRKRRMS
ncbi:MAG: SCO family protein [Betaproteobacteria bacterium]